MAQSAHQTFWGRRGGAVPEGQAAAALCAPTAPCPLPSARRGRGTPSPTGASGVTAPAPDERRWGRLRARGCRCRLTPLPLPGCWTPRAGPSRASGAVGGAGDALGAHSGLAACWALGNPAEKAAVHLSSYSVVKIIFIHLSVDRKHTDLQCHNKSSWQPQGSKYFGRSEWGLEQLNAEWTVKAF